jgi:hypothetical protein
MRLDGSIENQVRDKARRRVADEAGKVIEK